ncbi:MAG: hypothetical protein GWP75_02275 [Planctomycetia bacterium]|jgi:flagellar basal-body rod protein FlgB|nr:hypothetical protein [Planctomycetia bacterium]
MSDGIEGSGAIPYLQRLMQFSWKRNELLQDNIANIDTPGYRTRDVPVSEFQDAMREARDRQRSGIDAVARGAGVFEDRAAIRFSDRSIELRPVERGDNLLQHDGNDRNLEQLMQGLTENAMTFRFASELFRKSHDILRAAIRERP